MKEGAVGTHLHLVQTKRNVQPQERAERQHAAVSPCMSVGAHSGRGSGRNCGTPSTLREQENRNARIEELRARVQAGAYRVDSIALAESIMKNESHFLGAAL